MDMHCGGCAKKIRRVVRKFDGIEDVMVDIASQKLMVTGKVDPAMIKEILERKTNKKVEIVSPPPKKDGGGGGDKKPEEKPEKKAEEKKTEEKKTEDKKAEDKKPKETKFKIRTHCDGCIQKMEKIISKIKGVSGVSIDGDKDLVSVTGTVDPKELAALLREKLKRSVEVLPPSAKKDDGGSDKKEKEGGGASDVLVGGALVRPKLRPQLRPQLRPPSKLLPQLRPQLRRRAVQSTCWVCEPRLPESLRARRLRGAYGPSVAPMDPRFNPPQMFSDENPNACSVM
ncbi:hypothetical protein BT93_A1120 [Corymbia citriodora subsp. variegata]|nr:hypothetical protein BT93_A1120 [Corymbia citriodora subsp. variegata]